MGRRHSDGTDRDGESAYAYDSYHSTSRTSSVPPPADSRAQYTYGEHTALTDLTFSPSVTEFLPSQDVADSIDPLTLPSAAVAAGVNSMSQRLFVAADIERVPNSTPFSPRARSQLQYHGQPMQGQTPPASLLGLAASMSEQYLPATVTARASVNGGDVSGYDGATAPIASQSHTPSRRSSRTFGTQTQPHDHANAAHVQTPAGSLQVQVQSPNHHPFPQPRSPSPRSARVAPAGTSPLLSRPSPKGVAGANPRSPSGPPSPPPRLGSPRGSVSFAAAAVDVDVDVAIASETAATATLSRASPSLSHLHAAGHGVGHANINAYGAGALAMATTSTSTKASLASLHLPLPPPSPTLDFHPDYPKSARRFSFSDRYLHEGTCHCACCAFSVSVRSPLRSRFLSSILSFTQFVRIHARALYRSDSSSSSCQFHGFWSCCGTCCAQRFSQCTCRHVHL